MFLGLRIVLQAPEKKNMLENRAISSRNQKDISKGILTNM